MFHIVGTRHHFLEFLLKLRYLDLVWIWFAKNQIKLEETKSEHKPNREVFGFVWPARRAKRD
jgi:hypothetical protein